MKTRSPCSPENKEAQDDIACHSAVYSMHSSIPILLISHEPSVEATVSKVLQEPENTAFELTIACNLETATGLLSQQNYGVVLLYSATTEDTSSLQFLTEKFNLPTIVIHDSLDEDAGTKALIHGAHDFMSTENMNGLRHTIKRATVIGKRSHTPFAGTRDYQHRETHMEKIISKSADGMVIVDRHGTVQFANPAAETLFGYPLESLLGHPFGFPVVGGESTEIDIRQNGRAPAVAEMRVVELLWDGVTAYLATLRDITHRKQLEEALTNLVKGTALPTGQQFFRLLVTHLARALNVRYAFLGELVGAKRDTIRTAAVWGGTDYLDNFEYKLAGTPCENVVGKTTHFCTQNLQPILPNNHPLSEMDTQTYIGTPLFGSNDTPLGVLGIIHDHPVNDRQLAESILSIFAARASAELERQRSDEQAKIHQAELAHVSRLGTMGEMGTGIAHELSQPLTSISTFADIAKHMLDNENPAPHEMYDIVDNIGIQAIRANEIIQRLRKFVSKRPPTQNDVNLNVLISEVVGFVETDLRKHNIKLHMVLDEDIPQVRADAIQVEQVTLNLVRNAIEAMRDSETTTRKLRIQTGLHSEQHVRVLISDTGPGINQEDLNNIFMPFVTTKQEGLGIGLSLSRSIIESHGGKLWAESTPQQSTSFFFTLPSSVFT